MAEQTTFFVGILIVSTTAAKDPAADLSGKLLRDFFAEESQGVGGRYKWQVEETRIVSDNPHDICRVVKTWTDKKEYHLVVTTGGTGFAVADITPEAVKPLLEKEAPGLVHAMLSASLKITSFAMMSRLVAGVRNSSLIVCVPGSPKGAKENLEAIIKLLPHACTQAASITSSRALHSGGIKKLEKEHGVDKERSHSHHHHHSHASIEGPDTQSHHGQGHGGHRAPRPRTTPEQRANKLDGAVTGRYRESPYPMLPVPEAKSIIAKETSLGRVITLPVCEDIVGHVLAEDVVAAEAVPAYRASIVDGYAMHHEDGAGIYPVISVSLAAPGTLPIFFRGEVVRITTGAPLPLGATAVVMVEDTVLKSQTDDGKEERKIEVLTADLEDGENVREVGSDVAKGTVVLKKGDVITSIGGEVGLLASVGVAQVNVYRTPTVGVLSTGDEVVPHTRPGELKMGEIRDSNRPTILTAIKAAGFASVDLGIAADKPCSLKEILEDALQRVDVIITTGGVSMGELDLLKPTIEQSLSGSIHFGRVAMKPGKPTTFGTVVSGEKKTLIFALPGNPASALVTFNLFVHPSLRKAAGYENFELPKVRVEAGEDFKLDPRPEYHRVWVGMTAEGKLRATSTGGQRSSRIGSARGANAVLALPARGDVGEKRGSKGVIPKGDTVDAILWGQIGGIE